MTSYSEYKNFSFFKLAIGVLLLSLSLIYKNQLFILIPLISFSVAKAHSLGAWIAMWRAGKMNWKYTVSVCLILLTTFYLSFNLLNIEQITAIAFVLFALHFVFDEFELQQAKSSNFVYWVAPGIILIQLCSYTMEPFINTTFPTTYYLTLSLIALLADVSVLSKYKYDWFLINNKFISVFIAYLIINRVEVLYVFSVIILYHYIFWFIYPIYKLHKHKPEERDGFIMILIIIVLTSIYFSFTKSEQNPQTYEYALRYFSTLTIVHILTTAPFGYYLGLPRPKKVT
jgi:hypothetical protein